MAERDDIVRQPDVYDSQVAHWYIKDLPGMNNKLEELERQGKFVELAQNCRFEEAPGAVVKRPPVSFFNTSTIHNSCY